MAKQEGQDLLEIARGCIKRALAKGAKEVGATAGQNRSVSVKWRDGKAEKVSEAITRGVSLSLYVDGRYGVVRTGDLRPEALDAFVAESVEMTRAITPDPFRSLPDPKLYEGRTKDDLQLEDPVQPTVDPHQRREKARLLEEAARSVDGREAILSVTTSAGDVRGVSWRVHSNGFEGLFVGTSFSLDAEVTVKDADGRKPEDYTGAYTRFAADLPEISWIGRDAATRALSQRGSKKVASVVTKMAVDARACGRLLSALFQPLSGQAVQQRRSFLEDRLDKPFGSPLFTVMDEPHMRRGLGSCTFDGEGMASRPRALFDKGVLRMFYIDTYYAKKLKVSPTTGDPSNLVIPPGTTSPEGLFAQMKDGILVTGFLGGNSNPTTGDYSFGVQGFRISGGKKAEPVTEMTISGNLSALFGKLIAAGNDPYPYSRVKSPTLVFDAVQFAGM